MHPLRQASRSRADESNGRAVLAMAAILALPCVFDLDLGQVAAASIFVMIAYGMIKGT